MDMLHHSYIHIIIHTPTCILKHKAAQIIVIFTLQIAIRSSSVSLISLSAAATFFCLGEMSFQIGISHIGIGATLRSSASLKTV